MMMLLLFAALATLVVKAADDAKIDANSVVNDLQNGKRVVFAVGPVNSKMTLFISGPGGKSDVAAGCTVQMDENKDGVFKITNPPSKMPNGVSNADVIFVCVESSTSKLVTMSSSSIGAVNLPDGGVVQTKIKQENDIKTCFYDGGTHISSSKSLHYYAISSSGEVRNYHFDKNDIKSSDSCNSEGILGNLCTNENKIIVKEDCKGSSISNLVSGYVGGSTAYLFGSDNTVYVFDASAFKGQSVALKKVASKDAWKGKKIEPDPDDDDDNKPKPVRISTAGRWMIGGGVFFVILTCVFTAGYIIWNEDRIKKNKEEREKKRRAKGGSNKRKKSASSGHSSKSNKSKSKGGGASKSKNKSASKGGPGSSKGGPNSSKGGPSASKNGPSSSKGGGRSGSKQRPSSSKGGGPAPAPAPGSGVKSKAPSSSVKPGPSGKAKAAKGPQIKSPSFPPVRK
ncbi:hypothetical protein TYRP_005606 [Tyrophagus putrescentiae]|nr:hypothetical protein TYRP_005606 [Tyrophagus putrescentiae]